MRLSELVQGLPLAGVSGHDPAITGVTHDSRAVTSGDLFVAIVGERFDGRTFAGRAVEAGAAVIVGPAPEGEASSGSMLWNGVPWLVTDAPRDLLGPLAARVYGHPDRELTLVGVTGTNGKSTTITLIAAMLEASGLPAGTIGTLGYRLGEQVFAGERTTPEASDLFRMLRAMREAGAGAVAMEVSSHALALGRVAGAQFTTGVFTNLTRDHFDFHDGFEDYFAAKRKLFDQLAPGARPVVNLEDAYGRRLAEELPDVLTYGEGGEVFVEKAALEGGRSRGVIVTPRGPLRFETPLIGRYNLLNTVAATACAEAIELPHEAVVEALAGMQPIAGRMEPIDRGQPFAVFIDFAHTDAALEATLQSARELARGPMIVVFGCGGDKDKGKRKLMGRVAGELSDLAIVTSDNPRSEDPMEIIRMVEVGLAESGAADYRAEPDRKKAIQLAIELASPDATVIVAGKGHEAEQVIGSETFVFSDQDEVAAALEERFGPVAHR